MHMDVHGCTSNISLTDRKFDVQTTSIPRLELMSCLLLSELIEIVLSSISNSIDIKNVYCWSDSLDPLSWIKGENKIWKPFI